MTDQLPIQIAPTDRLLTAAEFQKLADVPPEVEWFANLSNPNTRRAYEAAVKDFMRFAGIRRPEEFRMVTRAHLIAWRDELRRRALGGATIRHRLAALASLFEYLCEKNAVTHNPVKGIERPRTESGEGKTPAIGDHQARKLLDAPEAETIKSKRDRAILSTLLFHALRRRDIAAPWRQKLERPGFERDLEYCAPLQRPHFESRILMDLMVSGWAMSLRPGGAGSVVVVFELRV